jgi:hydroxymethylpyrimidine/phosphomethylpyrimidine kinase
MAGVGGTLPMNGRRKRGQKGLLMEGKKAVVLTIAGFDPSSGAGVTADLKVFAKYGVYGVSAVTALTVQSTQGVRRVEPIWGRVVRETLECLADDVEGGYAQFAGVKIGMLGSAENVRVVVAFLRAAGFPRERVVLDPVIRSSSGAELLDPVGVGVLRDDLLEAVGWVTPNAGELGVLLREPVAGREAVPALAERLAAVARGLNVVVTGGDFEAPDDYLRTAAGEAMWLPGARIETTSTHGTGCAFSSALLCHLLAGDGPVEAVRGAKGFVREALENAVRIGKGRGPVLT